MTAERRGRHALGGDDVAARARDGHGREGFARGNAPAVGERFQRCWEDPGRPRGRAAGAREVGAAPLRRALCPADEWPTWLVLAGCYALWTAAVLGFETLGPIGFAIVGGYAIALHSSLQHEALHGHPTRSAALNEALIFPSLILVTPYRRMKTLHLRHHRDERLTDPYDDPESYYLPESDWRDLSPFMRMVLRVNGTLAGRLAVGPWLAAIGLWRGDLRLVLAGDRERWAIVDAYLRHAVGVAIVLSVAVGVGGLTVVEYLLFGVWPGYALLMIRTYAEHKAAEPVGERTAIVEAEAPFALLFLNNNLHAVHHAQPTAPWHRLPTIWRAERDKVLAENGHYLIPGYGAVVWRWLFRRREPVAHPFARRSATTDR